MSAPVPDLKRTIPPPGAGSECCNCCEGIEAETPQIIANPARLSQIAYSVGRYHQFRSTLHSALSSSEYGTLSGLLTREDSDFTIGLIDAFACSAEVLAFYQERLAHEAYLRTATERVSVQELGKLVGYALKPGLAAETWLAFALETPPSPPEQLSPEPGNFVTGVPSALRLETGLKVQSLPGADEKPQTFELVETLEDARPEWNAMQPWLSEARSPGPADVELWLDGTGTDLRAGDGLLFVGQEFASGANSAQWDFRVIASVEPDRQNDRTRISWAGGLGAVLTPADPTDQTRVYALIKRVGLFGNNAPIWVSMSEDFQTRYETKFGPETDGDWPMKEVIANSGSLLVDLESLQPSISADAATDLSGRSFAVLARAGTVALYTVVSATETSRAEFAIAAKVTRLKLSGPAIAPTNFDFVRATQVYAQSRLLELGRRPVAKPASGNRLPVASALAGLPKGRRLIVRGTPVGSTEPVVLQARVVAVHSISSELEITPALSAPLQRDTIVIHANVALASHGESVTQILGSGAAGATFQRFELKQMPLTYRAAEAGTTATAQLTVRVGDVAWGGRQTLYEAAPTQHAYVLDVDEQGRTFVAFGDGVRGARLPTGMNNVVARYRKGLGADGNVAAGTLTQLMTRPLGLKSVSNPLPAEGGTDPDSAEVAQSMIPLTTRTLERAVSVLDYEDFALASVGIAKGQAQVLNLASGPTVVLTLAGPKGAQLTPASPVWSGLSALLKTSGDPHVPVALLSYLAGTFRIGMRIKCASDRDSATVLSAVERALRGHFSFEARSLGQPVFQSEVVAAAQSVPGVIAVDLTRLYGGNEPGQSAIALHERLLAARMNATGGVAHPAELLTLDAGPFDLLEEMP